MSNENKSAASFKEREAQLESILTRYEIMLSSLQDVFAIISDIHKDVKNEYEKLQAEIAPAREEVD